MKKEEEVRDALDGILREMIKNPIPLSQFEGELSKRLPPGFEMYPSPARIREIEESFKNKRGSRRSDHAYHENYVAVGDDLYSVLYYLIIRKKRNVAKITHAHISNVIKIMTKRK